MLSHVNDILTTPLPEDIPFENKTYISLLLVYFIRRHLTCRFPNRNQNLKVDTTKFSDIFYYPIDNNFYLYKNDSRYYNIDAWLRDGVMPYIHSEKSMYSKERTFRPTNISNRHLTTEKN
jgi:hypothetical protein